MGVVGSTMQNTCTKRDCRGWEPVFAGWIPNHQCLLFARLSDLCLICLKEFSCDMQRERDNALRGEWLVKTVTCGHSRGQLGLMLDHCNVRAAIKTPLWWMSCMRGSLRFTSLWLPHYSSVDAYLIKHINVMFGLVWLYTLLNIWGALHVNYEI